VTREEAVEILTNLQNGHGVSYSEDYGLCFGHKWMQAYEMAISALREQEERSKGCSACDGGFGDNTMVFYAGGYKHCPMCGRRLEDT
jgi:hypothetical protein